MPCYHPMDAWSVEGQSSLCFEEIAASRLGILRKYTLSCGQCIGCRLRRARNWAVRCMHEASLYPLSSFVTLTYEHDYVPSLDYRDFQLFMKRLRKASGPTRFFAVGEYGADEDRKYLGGLGRPHFHALLFGKFFSDRKVHKKGLYKSAELAALWPHGFASVGNVSFQSAGYCARYCVDKVNGERAEKHYVRPDLDSGELVPVVPECAHMSLGRRAVGDGGIGYRFFLKYWREMYLARDGVMVNDKKFPAPKYYDQLLNASAPELASDVEYDRYVRSEQFVADCTPERLVVREVVQKARLNQLKRDL